MSFSPGALIKGSDEDSKLFPYMYLITSNQCTCSFGYEKHYHVVEVDNLGCETWIYAHELSLFEEV